MKIEILNRVAPRFKDLEIGTWYLCKGAPYIKTGDHEYYNPATECIVTTNDINFTCCTLLRYEIGGVFVTLDDLMVGETFAWRDEIYLKTKECYVCLSNPKPPLTVYNGVKVIRCSPTLKH